MLPVPLASPSTASLDGLRSGKTSRNSESRLTFPTCSQSQPEQITRQERVVS